MKRSLLNSIGTFDLQDKVVALETEHFDWAVQVSNPLPTEERQWRTYLNLLALAGFKEWLGRRAPNLPIQSDHCSIVDASYANVIDAVCNLEIASFKICLIVMEPRDHGAVSIPRAVVDLPEFAAHFYVLVEVLEEQEEAIVHSVLRYDQLTTQLTSHRLQPQPDWTFWLPLDWFDLDFTQLIVTLRCCEIYTLPLPKAPVRLAELSQHKDEIATALTQRVHADCDLWEVLSWEAGIAFLTTPQLVNWFYQQQIQSSTHAEGTLQSVFSRLTQPVFNCWNWMQETLDDLSHSWGWSMQPALTSVGAMRGDVSDPSRDLPHKSYRNVIAALNDRGIKLPTQEQNACIDLELGSEKLRLRAIPVPATPSPDQPETVAEWRLLIILDAHPDHPLSQEVTLQVSDDVELLDEQSFDPTNEDDYLFSCVVGGWDEQFIATIRLANGLSLTLPPFAFQPELSP